jgi:hypothetical protein
MNTRLYSVFEYLELAGDWDADAGAVELEAAGVFVDDEQPAAATIINTASNSAKTFENFFIWLSPLDLIKLLSFLDQYLVCTWQSINPNT